MKSIYFLFFVLVISSSATFAQDIITPDRPGPGYSATSVQTGRYQVEAGLLFNQDALLVGPLSFRTGLANNLELQADLGTVTKNYENDATVSVPSIGAKYSFSTPKQSNLKLGIFGRVQLPFLHDDYDYYQTRLILLADYRVNESVSVNSNFGFGDFVDDLGDGTFNFSVTPSYTVNEDIQVYLGASVDRFEDATLNLETGIAYLTSAFMQLDAHITFIDESVFIGAGVSTFF